MAVQKLGDAAVDTIVKLNEFGGSVNYIVVQQGKPSSLYDNSCDGTWVMRQDIHSIRQWDGSNNDYKNSDIHAWLNNDFLKLFDPDIQAAIKQVKIPYVNGTGGSAVASGANGLSCKIFLLSGYELGWTNRDNSYFPVDGAKLDYFTAGTSSAANQKRIAKYNGSAANWWTRSPNMGNYGTVWDVESGGDYYGSWNYNGTYGVRPAFILPSELLVSDDGTVSTNEPPTAPGSIEATNIIVKQQATITVSAATDPDGSIINYTYERKADEGNWTVFASENILSVKDNISDSWAKVTYRAKATDNLGVDGPYATSQEYTVIHNLPPSAPGSIKVTNVVIGSDANITITAATDSDGTIASYIYERSVDHGDFTQFANVNSLTQTDNVQSSWGVVAYRACAVDNDGASGPYVTSEAQTVNAGWVIIGGPSETMGEKPKPFNFEFSVTISDQDSPGTILTKVALDGIEIYNDSPEAGVQVSLPIDVRLLGAGTHEIEVQATKDEHLPASKKYTFTIPKVTLPDGGIAGCAETNDGRTVFYLTTAQRCLGRGGIDVQAQIDSLASKIKSLGV